MKLQIFCRHSKRPSNNLAQNKHLVYNTPNFLRSCLNCSGLINNIVVMPISFAGTLVKRTPPKSKIIALNIFNSRSRRYCPPVLTLSLFTIKALHNFPFAFSLLFVDGS